MDANDVNTNDMNESVNIIEDSRSAPKVSKASSVDDIIRLLDDYTESGGSRLKLQVVEGDEGVISRQYHHGRCDVGSPWATGQAFDVLDCGD